MQRLAMSVANGALNGVGNGNKDKEVLNHDYVQVQRLNDVLRQQILSLEEKLLVGKRERARERERKRRSECVL